MMIMIRMVAGGLVAEGGRWSRRDEVGDATTVAPPKLAAIIRMLNARSPACEGAFILLSSLTFPS